MPWEKIFPSVFLHLGFISTFLFGWNAPGKILFFLHLNFVSAYPVCLECPGALGEDIISANIFCRVLVTQLKYFKNVVSANIFYSVFVKQLKYFKNVILQQIFLQEIGHTAHLALLSLLGHRLLIRLFHLVGDYDDRDGHENVIQGSFLTVPPLKVLNVRVHSKSHQLSF